MNIRRFGTVALVVFVFFIGWHTATYTQTGRRYVDPRTQADAGLPPFSGAVIVGDTVYLAGEIGVDDKGQVPATAQEETRLVMDKIRNRLKSAGLTMDDLVMVQIFSSDVGDYAAFNEVYRTYFEKEFPARAYIGSGPLLFGARFEVQGIAVRR